MDNQGSDNWDSPGLPNINSNPKQSSRTPIEENDDWGDFEGGELDLFGSALPKISAPIQNNLGDFEREIVEAYNLLFSDKISGFPLTLKKIFDSKV